MIMHVRILDLGPELYDKPACVHVHDGQEKQKKNKIIHTNLSLNSRFLEM